MPRPATDIRQRILVGARELFGEQGVEGTSLRTIARRSGTSVGMIAYHFESKDGLFRAVVDEMYTPFLAELEAVGAAEPDPVARILAILRRIANVGESERRAMRIVLREASVQSPRLPYVAQRFLGGHVRLLVQALTEARATGRIREVSPLAVMPVLVGPIVVPQLLREILEPILGVHYEAILETTLDVILYGLVPRE